MILILAIFLIVFEAVSEGLSLRGHKLIAGIIEFIYRAVITLIIFVWLMGLIMLNYGGNFIYILIGYLFLRFALFDIIHNISAGLPIFYIGTTKLSDRLWQKFFKWSNFPINHFLSAVKFISLLIGITWLLTK